ncbi:MAG: HAD family hydrolase [Vicinamibacterales bacterium]
MGVTFSDEDIALLVAQKAARLEELEKSASVLFPGAREAIERMAAAGPVAIASGALKGENPSCLDHEGLRGHFPIVVGAEDTPASKPDPAPYLLAVSLLADRHPGLTAAECVAIEDSKWGLMSARDAGLRTVGITHTYPAAELTSAADVIIEHLDRFTPELLREL